MKIKGSGTGEKGWGTGGKGGERGERVGNGKERVGNGGERSRQFSKRVPSLPARIKYRASCRYQVQGLMQRLHPCAIVQVEGFDLPPGRGAWVSSL